MKRKFSEGRAHHNLRMSLRAYGKPRRGYKPTKTAKLPVSLARVSILEKQEDARQGTESR